MTKVFAIVGVAALSGLAGCTVKDVDAPPLAGPSTFAHSIVMVADRDILTQNGVDFTDIRITSLSPTGQSESIPLRAQVYVDGSPQDFGTLSSKTPVTPTTIRYTAPPAPVQAGAQNPTTITIGVVPMVAGDYRGEILRQLDIRLLPQGVILPTNPNLIAAFAVTPDPPQAFQQATFDASTSTNGGTACGLACTYDWDFGDGNTATGRTATHTYRTSGNTVVRLLVTDSRGAQAQSVRTFTVQAPTPPTATITATPANPVVGQDVFFSASATAAVGRQVVTYDWTFGDGRSASGRTATHSYEAQGTYTVTLRTTDDVGVVGTTTTSVAVAAGGPSVSFTFLPASPRVGQPVTVNITATPTGATTIRSYSVSWGDGSPVETGQNTTQSHVYNGSGSVVITVTATDSLGHSRSATQTVTIAP